MRTGCPEELVSLVQHAVTGKTILEHFKVTGFQHAGVFLHLFEVRIHAALARFVGDDRHVDGRFLTEVPIGGGLALVDGDPAPVLIPDIGGYMGGVILVCLDVRTGCGGGIEMAGVVSLSLLHKVFQHSEVAFVLITVTVEDKGGVVAILVQNGIHLLLEEVAASGVSADILDPHRKFHLQVQSEFVGRIESGFRGAPGMKADMVHPVIFHRTHDTLPLLHIRSRIAGDREDTAVQDTAQVDIAAVQADMMASLFHVAHTENR